MDAIKFELEAKLKAEKFTWKNLVFGKIEEKYTLTCDVIMTSLKGHETL